MKRIDQFDGLYGEANARPSADYLFSELIETRSHTFDWVILPHIHARLFQLFFIQTGSFDLEEEAGKRTLTGPTLLLIPPTAIHGFVYEYGVRGRILTMSDALVNALFPDVSPVTAMFNSLQCLNSFGELHTTDRIEQLMALIEDEAAGSHPEKQLMLHACLQNSYFWFSTVSGKRMSHRR